MIGVGVRKQHKESTEAYHGVGIKSRICLQVLWHTDR